MAKASKATIKVTTLGRVTVDGQRTRQLRPLEALVLLHLHDGWVLRDAVRAALFGEASARSTLSSLMTRLRRMGFRVEEEGAGYRLLTRPDLDVTRFSRALEAGDVDAALRLYKGPFMPGSPTPFAHELRTYLEEALVAAVLEARPLKPRWLREVLRRTGPDARLADALEAVSPAGLVLPSVRAQIAGAGLA
ncbi:hypothetical protein [Oceanithermus sp.]|uniref:hypothetical protein n=1 Tax=Oceanithermus sp. TaxID=2268145 RepID=UPI00257F4623|nr:hypothetical protein [Oceanithermus sp.]